MNTQRSDCYGIMLYPYVFVAVSDKQESFGRTFGCTETLILLGNEQVMFVFPVRIQPPKSVTETRGDQKLIE